MTAYAYKLHLMCDKNLTNRLHRFRSGEYKTVCYSRSIVAWSGASTSLSWWHQLRRWQRPPPSAINGR